MHSITDGNGMSKCSFNPVDTVRITLSDNLKWGDYFIDSGRVFSGTLYASDALTQLGSNPSGRNCGAGLQYKP